MSSIRVATGDMRYAIRTTHTYLYLHLYASSRWLVISVTVLLLIRGDINMCTAGFVFGNGIVSSSAQGRVHVPHKKVSASASSGVFRVAVCHVYVHFGLRVCSSLQRDVLCSPAPVLFLSPVGLMSHAVGPCAPITRLMLCLL
jgi:hypothetical protein